MSTRIEIQQTPEPLVGAKLMKTGQTTSYITGDDGDLQEGRDISFIVLPAPNVFGNINRFTDTQGGQGYTNDIVIDWSTYQGSRVLGYYRIIAGNQTWANAIASANALSVGTFTTGWRMANFREVTNVFFYRVGINHMLDYSPFDSTITGPHSLWTSTTDIANSINAYFCGTLYGIIGVVDKTAVGAKFLAVRTFNWDGTQLT